MYFGYQPKILSSMFQSLIATHAEMSATLSLLVLQRAIGCFPNLTEPVVVSWNELRSVLKQVMVSITTLKTHRLFNRLAIDIW
jgi:hypothetical protein